MRREPRPSSDDPEYMLHWSWTDAGFKAELPQIVERSPDRLGTPMRLGLLLLPAAMAPIMLVVPALAALEVPDGSLVRPCAAVTVMLFIFLYVDLTLARREDPAVMAARPPTIRRIAPFPLEVDGATLHFGPHEIPLGDIEEVRFEQDRLRIVSRRNTWWQTELVPPGWSHPARAFLVHWLTEAAREARGIEAQRQEGEARARRAMAALRSRSGEGRSGSG